MSSLAGTVDIVSGVVYLLLGCNALVESVGPARPGASRRFGLALTLLAFAGGTPALLGGIGLVTGGGNSSAPHLAATSLGLLPATVFCWLRYEAYLGRAGERIIHGNPSWVPLLPAAFAFGSGAILVMAWVGRGPVTLLSAPDAAVAGMFLPIGWFLLRAQQIRHGMAGGWSLSGLAATMIFPTWAVTHATQILGGEVSRTVRIIDWVAVAAAMWFLIECRRLVGSANRSGRRATLAVSPLRARRPAPWAVTGSR
jgi:hypothetical protein